MLPACFCYLFVMCHANQLLFNLSAIVVNICPKKYCNKSYIKFGCRWVVPLAGHSMTMIKYSEKCYSLTHNTGCLILILQVYENNMKTTQWLPLSVQPLTPC